MLATLGWIVAAFKMSGAYGESRFPFVQILLSPFVLILGVIVIRIYCEMLILAFRVVEHLSEISRNCEQIAHIREPLDRIADGVSQSKPPADQGGA